MKKALILTYYWPPGSGPGVQRWLKFCKYLPENGWQPEVITVMNGSYPSLDPSLLDDVPSDLRVHRTKAMEPFAIYNAMRGKKGKAIEVGMGNLKGNPSTFAKLANFVRANYFIPDARIGWNYFAKKQALEVIGKQRPDVIITTGPPHSTHLIGLSLHKETGIPWLADFRDPWTTIYYNVLLNRTAASIKKDAQLEDSVLAAASAVIVATPGLKSEFESRAKQIAFIPNGYDEDDFESAPEEDNTKHFTLAYVGNLKAFQNTETLWRVLRELKQERVAEDGFKFEITGNVAPSVVAAFEQNDILDLVTIKPFVPHKTSVKVMRKATMLLLPIPMSEGNHNILTGKLFEYLAAQRPILSLGPTTGDASKILKECGKEPMFDYGDAQGIKEFLRGAIKAHTTGHFPKQSGNENFKAYSRKGTTQSLVNLMKMM